MEGEADNRCEAPAFLVYVEQQTGQFTFSGVVVGNDVAAVVSVVVIGAETYCCSQSVKNLIAEVGLPSVDVLLTFHVGINGILVRGDGWDGSLRSVRQSLG